MTTARELLDAAQRTHSRYAIVRELTILDQEADTDVKDWWERYEARARQDDPTDPPRRAVWIRRIDGLMFCGAKGLTAIEVKISRSDFARETEAKRRAWRKVTNRFVYLTPAGLLTPAALPDYCGLWELDPATGYVKVAKPCKVNKEPDPLPRAITQALAYRVSRCRCR